MGCVAKGCDQTCRLGQHRSCITACPSPSTATSTRSSRTNIDILCANAPQAKGRVERAHKTTLQDRLVKDLRLAGANDIDAGNALLPVFMANYNRLFGKPSRNDKNLHRPLAPQDDLDGSFAGRVARAVTQSLTVHYDRVMFILEPKDITRALPRKKVTVYDFPDGRIEVRHQRLALPYRTLTASPAWIKAP
jgi:hypothetical protein